jgi:Protein of unknown function (DUF3309)
LGRGLGTVLALTGVLWPGALIMLRGHPSTGRPEPGSIVPRWFFGRGTTLGMAMLGTILLIILILILIGALPTWPYSGGWGYYPSGGIGLLLVILIILLVIGRI